jgi:diacylglycerol kinase family enzyme
MIKTVDGPIDVIVNGIARSVDWAAFIDQLRQLVTHDSQWRIAIASSASELERLVNEAVHSDSHVVVAAGGDGTVNTVANKIVGTSKVLGVLPAGTLNHFAKNLHLPINLADAVATIARGKTIEVDTAEVNGHKFVNNSSLGLYPQIVTERQKHQRLGWGKWPAFLWAAWSVLRRYPFVDVRLGVSGMSLNRRTPFVFIGNNRYEMEGLNIGARPSLQEHQLSLYTTNRTTNRFGLLILGLRALLKRLQTDDDFLEVCTDEIWIGTQHRHLRVALDGEVIVLKPPLQYRILPQSLRVIVPAADMPKST